MSSLWYPSVKQAPMSMGGMGGVVASYNFRSAGGGGGLVGEDYSVDFDGNDFLSVPANSAYHIGSGDYTVELWMYKDSDGELISAFEQPSPWTGWLMGTNFGASSKLAFYIMNQAGNSHVTMHSTNTVAYQQWQHLAVSKSSNTWRFFLDGTLDATHTSTIDPGDSGENIMIGADKNYPTLYRAFDGKISNVRITKGQCLYTSSFTPSTSPLGTLTQGATGSNVKLLCCNQSSVTGSVVTTGTITTVGDPTSADGPF